MKKTIKICCIVVLFFSLIACGEKDPATTDTQTTSKQSDKWLIYLYLCGSDLESGYGAATSDLSEILLVDLPDNVSVLIQTGGSYQWDNDKVDPNFTQRFLYTSKGLKKVYEGETENMGDSSTLANFLAFGKKKYKANKQVFIFWNHGGGSVAGVAFDELYDYDSLTLNEIRDGFSQVYDSTSEQRPFEIIGFDTCLMATIDTAAIVKDYSNYMVASEEYEPGIGWAYDLWLSALADNPSMSSLELGTAICDTYYEACDELSLADEITLSVTNLNKIDRLLKAYDSLGKEALTLASEDSSFFTRFSRLSNTIENYGGNTKEAGYTNMADLGHLARKGEKLFPTQSAAILKALDQCVDYRIFGRYRSQSTGLSCYYSFNYDQNDLTNYLKIGTSKNFNSFYTYTILGEIDKNAKSQITKLSKPETLETLGWEGHKVTLKDGYAILNLGKKADSVLTNISFDLYYADAENDVLVLLGNDNDITADWEKGIFTDNFRGVWGAIDGHYVTMELNYGDEDYNLYNVPILLNGEEVILSVAYDFNDEQFSILGTRKAIDDNGMADKNLRQLVIGDEITVLLYFYEDGYFVPYESDTFSVTEDTMFHEEDIGDGQFIMSFVMEDAEGNIAYSEDIYIDYYDGEYTFTTY